MVTRTAAWPPATVLSRPWTRRVADAVRAWWTRERALRELQALAEVDHRTLADIGWPARFTPD